MSNNPNNLYLVLIYKDGRFQHMMRMISKFGWKEIERNYMRNGRIQRFKNMDTWQMIEARIVDSLSFDELSLLDGAVLICKDKNGMLREEDASDIKKNIFIQRLAGI